MHLAEEREELDLEKLRGLEKDDITVAELEKLAEACYALKKEKSDIEKMKSKKHAELVEHQEVMGVLLDKLEITSYRSKKGTISKREEPNYRLPQDDESRSKFFGYLKDQGVFDTMITVNANTLKSFIKQEVEKAELDNNFDFVPPGIEETEYRTVYSMKK